MYATRTETVTASAAATSTAASAGATGATGYVYKVFGASRGSITYSSAGGGSSQATNAKLPWTKTVESPGYGGMTFAYVSAQNGGGGTIRCQIIGPSGQVIAENSAEGEYAIVTCSP
ncbi:hypothetical protein Acsp07_54110 [Actinomycetospora sp. NBRC 106378]|nr:hypothetical protein Acsp07_54110 [Actinomycetospora sp. NBRC 106378]